MLWPEEVKLTAHVLKINEKGLARKEAECGCFRDDTSLAFVSLPVAPTSSLPREGPDSPAAIQRLTVSIPPTASHFHLDDDGLV